MQDTDHALTEDETKLHFERFSQVPHTYSNYGGSGLNLFVFKESMEMQGGEVGTMSPACVGSAFGFYVKTQRAPAAMTGSALGQAQSHRSSMKRGRSEVQPSTSLSHAPTIQILKQEGKVYALVVEDRLVKQRVLDRLLLKIGYEVSIANHDSEAPEFLRRTKFWEGEEMCGEDLSVVLMDLKMPPTNGISCARRIRRLEREGSVRGHVPIIAIAATVRSDQINAALEAGTLHEAAPSNPLPFLRRACCIHSAFSSCTSDEFILL